MSEPVRILIVEDVPTDFELAQREIRKAVNDCVIQQVQTRQEFLGALETFQPDLILSDYQMPRFDGMAALQLTQEHAKLTPFIIWTGTMGEDIAVELMKAGAVNYILKENLKRLGPAVAHALEERRLLLEHKRAEETIHNNEKRFRTLIENGRDNISLLAADGTLLWESPATVRSLGHAQDEFVGHNIFELIHPDDRKWMSELYAKLLQEPGSRQDGVFRLRHRDGSWRWNEATVTNMLNEPGVNAIVANYRDITERKQSEMERQALLEIMQGLADTDNLQEFLKLIHHSIARVIYAQNFFVVFYNKDSGLFEEIYSVDKYDEPAPPSALEKSITSYVFRSGEPLLLTQARFDELAEQGEVELVGTDSESWLGAPLKTQNGTIGVIAVQHYEDPNRYTERDRDFLALIGSQVALAIERKRAEEALRRRELEFRSLTENIPDVVARFDRQLRHIYINDVIEKITGTPAQFFISKTNHEMDMPVPQVALWDDSLQHVFEDGQAMTIEFEFPSPAGPRYFESRLVPELGLTSEVESVLSIARDITEQKRSADQLKYHARLLRHINDAVIATDDQFRITAWNRAAEKMYGWRNEEVMGRTVSEILSFELTDEERAAARELLKESATSRSERIYHRRDGRTIYVEANTIALLDQYGKMTGYVSVHRDITERKRAEEQAQLQIQRLQALRAIDIVISSSLNLGLTLDLLLDQVTAQLKTDAAAILLFHSITNTLEHAASRGFRSRTIREARLRLGEGYAGQAVLERRMIHISNLVETDPELNYALSLKTENFMEYYCVPLIVKGEVKGVLEIFHRSALAGEPEWVDFLETLAGQAAIAIDNATLFENLQDSNNELFQAYDATIEGWSHALDLRDKETEGHSLRVTEMTLELARKFGFTDEQLRHIRWGALLHDIGKMGIPDHILLKLDKLTDEEWERMKQHPGFAFEMLSPITYLKSSLDIPYCHHEKWDGTGYPRGLKGNVIPLAARLFAIVDVWDALRSDRPYRKGWSAEKTREHIQSLSGTHFDPQVVEYFLEMIERPNR